MSNLSRRWVYFTAAMTVAWLLGSVVTVRTGYRVEGHFKGHHPIVHLSHGVIQVDWGSVYLGYDRPEIFSRVHHYPAPGYNQPDEDGDGLVVLDESFVPPVAYHAPVNFQEAIRTMFPASYLLRGSPLRKWIVGIPLWMVPLSAIVAWVAVLIWQTKRNSP